MIWTCGVENEKKTHAETQTNICMHCLSLSYITNSIYIHKNAKQCTTVQLKDKKLFQQANNWLNGFSVFIFNLCIALSKSRLQKCFWHFLPIFFFDWCVCVHFFLWIVCLFICSFSSTKPIYYNVRLYSFQIHLLCMMKKRVERERWNERLASIVEMGKWISPFFDNILLLSVFEITVKPEIMSFSWILLCCWTMDENGISMNNLQMSNESSKCVCM